MRSNPPASPSIDRGRRFTKGQGPGLPESSYESPFDCRSSRIIFIVGLSRSVRCITRCCTLVSLAPHVRSAANSRTHCNITAIGMAHARRAYTIHVHRPRTYITYITEYVTHVSTSPRERTFPHPPRCYKCRVCACSNVARGERGVPCYESFHVMCCHVEYHTHVLLPRCQRQVLGVDVCPVLVTWAVLRLDSSVRHCFLAMHRTAHSPH